MITDWWVSNPRMTFWVRTHDEVIIDAAPIARRFVGQPFRNLVRWMRRIGGAEYVQLAGGESDARTH